MRDAPPRLDRRRSLLTLGSLLGSVVLGRQAHGAGVMGPVAVRMWPADEYTRVTLESDSPLTARHSLLEGPDRLVIDIDGLELDPALRAMVGQVKTDDPFIAGLRVGQYQPKVVRLVLDLRQATAPQIFTLAPVAAYRHRLVFDLYPMQAKDPLLALIREKEQAEGQAAQSVRDALGEFIGRVDKPLNATGAAPAAPAASAAPARTAAPPPPPSPALLSRVKRLIVVALDPGHGGEDPGAVGPTGLQEKDVVLAVALQLRERINAVPGMRAFLTRNADYFVPLHERVRKARRVQADLFVSLHADAFFRPQARGASVFALSHNGASSSAARWMANKENAADVVGGVNSKATDASVLRAMLDMSTTAQIKDSLRVGSEVLGQLDQVGRLHKARVEQAGFAVLKAPDIPSILVETAFISNPDEEALLRDPDYQAQLVAALASGIKRYFAKHPPLARRRAL